MDFGRIFESYYNLPREHSRSIIITDSDCIITDRMCAIGITSDMSSRTALAAEFSREYKNIEFLGKQRAVIGIIAALRPAASQIPGKKIKFLGDEGAEKQHVDPEDLVLSQT